MINKKVSTVAGSLIILAIIVALVFSFLVSNKKEEAQNQNNAVLNDLGLRNGEKTKQEEEKVFGNDENQKNTKNFTNDDKDTVVFKQGDNLYEINIATKGKEIFSEIEDNLNNFTGLPKETKNNKISVSKSESILSQNKTKVIVIFSTFDETKKPNELDGALPVLNREEFTCDIVAKNCTKTNYINAAKALTSGPIGWYKWDSVNNLLFGHLSGEGVGNVSPVYIYNMNANEIQRTIGYNSLNEKEEKRAEVPVEAFSPSLSRFIMIYNNKSLLLYNSKNLLSPLKELDVSAIDDGVKSLSWAEDEKNIVIETRKNIYTLNLDNGEIALIYSDTSMDPVGLWLNFHSIDISPSGRYITFIDYEERDDTFKEKGFNTVLKAIDLKENNKVIELLREKNISFIYN